MHIGQLKILRYSGWLCQNNMKYIIVDHNGIELPIVFNDKIMRHDEVYPRNQEIVSAGFCRHTNNAWWCWGQSVSLNKMSRFADDAAILQRFLT